MKIFKIMIYIVFLFCALNSYAANKTLRVAVIDTGFDYKSHWIDIDNKKTYDGQVLRKPKLCNTGHKDFSGTGLQDTNGHGTHISGLIATYAGDVDYCLMIIKFTDTKKPVYSSDAFKYAIEQGADIINFSAFGYGFDLNEYQIIQKALSKNIKIVVAAGNHSSDTPKEVPRMINKIITDVIVDSENKVTIQYFDRLSNYITYGERDGAYPANYDRRIFAITNVDKYGKIHRSSMYGKAYQYEEVGVNVLSLGMRNTYKKYTGTSMSAAKFTGKLIKKLTNK